VNALTSKINHKIFKLVRLFPADSFEETLNNELNDILDENLTENEVKINALTSVKAHIFQCVV
jgi:hypothetical protein